MPDSPFPACALRTGWRRGWCARSLHVESAGFSLCGGKPFRKRFCPIHCRNGNMARSVCQRELRIPVLGRRGSRGVAEPGIHVHHARPERKPEGCLPLQPRESGQSRTSQGHLYAEPAGLAQQCGQPEQCHHWQIQSRHAALAQCIRQHWL